MRTLGNSRRSASRDPPQKSAVSFLLKTLHILSANVLLGTGIGIAFFKWITDRSGSVAAIRVVSERVVLADTIFTAPARLPAALERSPALDLARASRHHRLGRAVPGPAIRGRRLLTAGIVDSHATAPHRPSGGGVGHRATGGVRAPVAQLVLARHTGLHVTAGRRLANGLQTILTDESVPPPTAAAVIALTAIARSATARMNRLSAKCPIETFAALQEKRCRRPKRSSPSLCTMVPTIE